MFRFRKMTTKDFPRMLHWLGKEHIKEWWNDGDDTLEKVALHYGGQSDEVERFILVETHENERNIEKPIGYFQLYFVSDNTIGIDQFIGEEDCLNRGVGEKTIKMFVDLVKEKHKPNRIILDPSPDNKRAVRCYEKVGFKHYETKVDENHRTTRMMSLEF